MLKLFKVDQSNRVEFTGKIGTLSILMLTDSGFESLRATNVVFTIGTFQDIHISFHFVFNYWSYKYQGKIVVERSRNNNSVRFDSAQRPEKAYGANYMFISTPLNEHVV